MDKLGGVLFVVCLVYWFVGCGEEHAADRARVSKVLPPVAELVIESKLKWAKTIAAGLKTAGWAMEIEYILSDGEKGRATYPIDETKRRSLKSGDKIRIRDIDGIEKEFTLTEVTHVEKPAPPRKKVFVRFHLDHIEGRTIPEPAALKLVERVKSIPGIPYWVRPAAGTKLEVTYGPLLPPQDRFFDTFSEAQSHAKDLRAAGFSATIDSLPGL